jgi:hypothetical protein
MTKKEDAKTDTGNEGEIEALKKKVERLEKTLNTVIRLVPDLDDIKVMHEPQIVVERETDAEVEYINSPPYTEYFKLDLTPALTEILALIKMALKKGIEENTIYKTLEEYKKATPPIKDPGVSISAIMDVDRKKRKRHVISFYLTRLHEKNYLSRQIIGRRVFYRVVPQDSE